MKKLLFFVLSLVPSLSQAQISKNQFSFSGVYGLILSNDLTQTSRNYDWYPGSSGVNLKCAAINGLQLQFQHFFKDSKWFASAHYDRRWLNCTTTLYSANYDPNTVYNYTKNVELNTQFESFSLGAGRRFVIPNSRFSVDFSTAFTYKFFADNKLSTTSPELGFGYPTDIEMTQDLDDGDFFYYVEMDYTYYAKLLNFSALSSIKYQLNSKLDLQFNLSISNSLKGAYSFETITKGPVEVIGNTIINNIHFDNYDNIGNVRTRYLNLGLGLNYKF